MFQTTNQDMCAADPLLMARPVLGQELLPQEEVTGITIHLELYFVTSRMRYKHPPGKPYRKTIEKLRKYGKTRGKPQENMGFTIRFHQNMARWKMDHL